MGFIPYFLIKHEALTNLDYKAYYTASNNDIIQLLDTARYLDKYIELNILYPLANTFLDTANGIGIGIFRSIFKYLVLSLVLSLVANLFILYKILYNLFV